MDWSRAIYRCGDEVSFLPPPGRAKDNPTDVHSYLNVRYGLVWTDLKDLTVPLRVGDVVVLPGKLRFISTTEGNQSSHWIFTWSGQFWVPIRISYIGLSHLAMRVLTTRSTSNGQTWIRRIVERLGFYGAEYGTDP